MEGTTAKSSWYKGLRGNPSKKNYVRINGSALRRKNGVEVATMGRTTRRRRFWRVRPKLRFFKSINASTPKKFLNKLRDAYVKMMVAFAGSRVCNNSIGGGEDAYSYGTRFGKTPIKEYDEKMVIEIYKTLMAQDQLLPRDAVRTAGKIAC